MSNFNAIKLGNMTLASGGDGGNRCTKRRQFQTFHGALEPFSDAAPLLRQRAAEFRGRLACGDPRAKIGFPFASRIPH
jgi:hypothetical protein